MAKIPISNAKAGDRFFSGNEEWIVISDPWDLYHENDSCSIKAVSLETGKTMRFGGDKDDMMEVIRNEPEKIHDSFLDALRKYLKGDPKILAADDPINLRIGFLLEDPITGKEINPTCTQDLLHKFYPELLRELLEKRLKED